MKRARIDRFHPVITIQNESKSTTNADVRHAIRALQKQIDRDFAPVWGLTAKLVFGEAQARAMRVVIRDVSDEAGDLGYHFSGDGYPVTYVFAKDDIDAFKEYTSTLSHELLEMIADPGANLYADGFYRIKRRRRRAAMIPYEVCDAVQDFRYKIDGVYVSDFLYPEWFEPEHKGRMRMDKMGKVWHPFELAKGGYTDVVVGHKFMTVYSHKKREKTQRHRHSRRKANFEALGAR
jgi:hypothetical protein